LYEELRNGTYVGSTYSHYYSLNLANAGNVFLRVAGDSGASGIYDSNLNLLSRITSEPIYLDAGTYVVNARYSSPNLAALNVYVPQLTSASDLEQLGTGSYVGSTWDHYYGLTVSSSGPVLIRITGDNGTSALYDRALNFISKITEGPMLLDAGSYIIHAAYSSKNQAVLDALIPSRSDPFIGDDRPNIFQGSPGNDYVDGGGGIDRFVFQGLLAQYTVAPSGIETSVGGPEGVDKFLSVERLQFQDAVIAFDTSGTAGQAYRLYQAAFNRTPDQPGLGYQINALETGLTLKQVAQNFLDSPEFSRTYGGLSDSQFVAQLYLNVLRRTPENAGLAYHVNDLANGVERAQILANFSESPENQAALIGTIEGGMIYQW